MLLSRLDRYREKRLEAVPRGRSVKQRLRRCTCNPARIVLLSTVKPSNYIPTRNDTGIDRKLRESLRRIATRKPHNKLPQLPPKEDARPFCLRAAMHLPCRVGTASGGIASVEELARRKKITARQEPTGSVRSFPTGGAHVAACKLNDIR